MPKTLKEQREDWENELVVVAEKQLDEWTFLVILRWTAENSLAPYFCHRYFSIGDSWEISVDESEIDAESAMRWAFESR